MLNKVYPNKECIYLLGIGGIGMSALARYFHLAGHRVAGYDRVKSKLTEELTSEGIDIHYEDSANAIPDRFKDASITLAIYTPAIPKENKEFLYFEQNNFDLVKRSVVLGNISSKYFTIAISGTHGKTTTSSILTHILKSSGKKIMAFVGGINMNNHSNVILDEAAELLVTEADEYDKSFLTLHPDILLITSIDPDHLDIYSEPNQLINSYQTLASQLKPGGVLLINHEIAAHFENFNFQTYGIEKGDHQITEHRLNGVQHDFSATINTKKIENCHFNLPGKHNLSNALGASILSSLVGVKIDDIAASLNSYRGVKRRFEIHINSGDYVYIDDYAHHPEEIKSCINAAKTSFPNRKITVIFQPHLFSRTRDFLDEFAAVLSTVNKVILMQIYPAQENPIPGITSNILLDKIDCKNKKLLTPVEILNEVKQDSIDVLITMGAGDIDKLVEPIIKELS